MRAAAARTARTARIAVIAAIAGAGCFYTDPMNQRPSIEIEQLTYTQVFRGQLVNLAADSDDPNGDAVDLDWRAYACSDATAAPDGTRPGCDGFAIASSNTKQFSFQVPDNRADGVTPTAAMYVTLDATDSLGAAAKPGQELVIPVADAPPTLALAAEPRPSYVVGIPVPIYAKVGDPDDPASNIGVVWTAFSPTGSEPLTTEQTQPVGSDLQLTTTLVPDQLGVWTVQAVATDPSGSATPQSIDVVATPDQPPCLTAWSPSAPPPGESLPISSATLFQVLVVTDDLDPYPPVTGDPYLGTTTFSWSLLPPGGGSREPLPATGAGVALDPASYEPGDVVELRVEIHDRDPDHVVACDDDDPTCSIGANSCTQRLTWRVEMQ